MRKRIIITMLFFAVCSSTGCASAPSSTGETGNLEEQAETPVEKLDEALEQTESAIDTGDAQALIDEGRNYWYALNGREKDNDKALEFFLEAAEYDVADAWYYVGVIYNDRSEFENAVSAYDKAIDLGSDLARFNMGRLHQFGEGVDLDYEKARLCFEESVNNGCFDAYNGLGDLYLEGLGVEKDYERAVEYFVKAAENASEPDWRVYAYEALGWIYYSDQSAIQHDYEKSISYYTEADKIAGTWTIKQKLSIAEVLAEGMGDSEGAQEWIKKAEDNVISTDFSGLDKLGFFL